MTHFLTPKLSFFICKLIGFGLLFFHWLDGGEITGFFLFLFLVVLTLFRWRMPQFWGLIVLDTILLAFFNLWLILSLLLVSEVFFRLWESDRQHTLSLRDEEAGRYYEMQSLQSDLSEALAQVERMTAVSERTRIARDIHDNAGHEIVAAYMSLQTARTLMDGENQDALELYDLALERLDKGANKIRESVHNLSAITALGVDNLEEICRNFPGPQTSFHVYGDTSKIPMYIWNMLVSCLNESLTNAARHAKAKTITVSLDTTPHIVRFCVENDGIRTAKKPLMGSGLRNLRHRAAAVGGSLSVDAGEVFRLICVIPLKEEINQ